MALSIVNIARNSLKFTSVNFLAALMSFFVTIYVATILVPEEYGEFGFLSLWLMYAGLIGPGIASAASREMPVLIGRDREKEALRVQNISVTTELLFTIIPFVVILGASFFYSEPVLKFGLLIIAISYIASRLVGFWSHMNFIRERFNIVAKVRLITAIIPPVVILASIYWLKVYALLLAPVIGSIVCGIYYWKKGSINYHFIFDRAEVVRLVKVGIVLQGLNLIYWGFRLADRTIIASMLPFEQLGLYAFAMGFLMYASMLFEDFTRVLQPILWREAGKADSIIEGFQDTRRITVYLALVVGILIPLAQLGFFLIVRVITRNYIDSIPIFYVLSYNLYFIMIGIIPALVLNSSLINKQKLTLYCFSVGLALNIIFDILVIKLGYGVIGVTLVTVCTQGLVSFILYYFVKGYVFRDTKQFLIFLLRIIVPFMIAVPFYFLHTYLDVIAPNFWVFIGVSLAAQLVTWTLLIGIFYRNYLSATDIKILAKEIKMLVTRR